MEQSGTYGDHITLEAASNLSNIEIKIASSLGHHARTMIQPQEYEPIRVILLKAVVNIRCVGSVFCSFEYD